MNKFEQLIEYVINDDESKARELFHDIVVEKSREIYENLMNEEEQDSEEELDEDQTIGGDSADELIDAVETEEEGMCEEEGEEIELDAEEDGEEDGEEEVEFDSEDDAGEEELEDRVVDLEDKLDELMAEFEAMMGGESSEEDELEVGAGGDALEMDDTEEFTDEGQMGFMEGVDLKAAPKPVTSEEGNTNTKSTVAVNSGAVGAVAKPVTTTGAEAKGRPAPTAKDMGGTTSPKQGPATKPVTTQASGVNTTTPFPKA